MLKKKIKYETFDGETVEEEFHFHLSKAELVTLEMSQKGGMKEYLERIIASEDGKAIMSEFKRIIEMSVGKKSDDGRRFLKTKELTEDFMSSPAYDVLFMEMVTNAESAAAFIAGVVPANLDGFEPASGKPVVAGQIVDEEHPLGKTPPGRDDLPQTPIEQDRAQQLANATPVAPVTLTREELVGIDRDELQSGLASGRFVFGS